MALATTTTRTPTVTRCPVCGGLECLCRPRFFAGQLLTDEDLNRLEHYIIGKNKLHNRYLHGWGVVCGLEVSCNPCKGFVNVKSGYALSPCGDDIIVCGDTAVNVCELIQDCRTQQFNCEPAWPQADPVCGDQDEQWVLYICYDERSSRGVTPLQGGNGAARCTPCACGGSSSCGCRGTTSSNCGCKGNATTGSVKTNLRSKPASPPQCEPTVTCEGYNFKLRKLPVKPLEQSPGELIERLRECLNEIAKLQAILNRVDDSSQPGTEILAIRNALLDLMNQHSIYNCDLFQRISQVEINVPSTGISTGTNAQSSLSTLIQELFRECVCSALLPPCPPPAEDNCVPIATLTLNCKAGCRVVRICNWENRRLLIGFPTLEYWFESLIRQLGISDIFARLCCAQRTPQFEGISRLDVVDNIFNEAVLGGGNISSQAVFRHLGNMLKEMASFTNQ